MAAPPGPDGVGLVALAGTEPERIVAIARYHRQPGAAEAELAVAVADAWHGLGLGTGLIERLRERAAADGPGRPVGVRTSGQLEDARRLPRARGRRARDERAGRVPGAHPAPFGRRPGGGERRALRHGGRRLARAPVPAPRHRRRGRVAEPRLARRGASSPRSPGAASPGLCTRSTARPARSPGGPPIPRWPPLPEPVDLVVVAVPAGRGPRRRAAGRRLRRPRPAGAVLRLLGGGRRRGGPRGRARAHRAHQRDADGRPQLPGHRGHGRWRRTSTPPSRPSARRRGAWPSPRRAAVSGSRPCRTARRGGWGSRPSSASGTRPTCRPTTCSRGGTATPGRAWCSSTSRTSATRDASAMSRGGSRAERPSWRSRPAAARRGSARPALTPQPWRPARRRPTRSSTSPASSGHRRSRSCWRRASCSRPSRCPRATAWGSSPTPEGPPSWRPTRARRWASRCRPSAPIFRRCSPGRRPRSPARPTRSIWGREPAARALPPPAGP